MNFLNFSNTKVSHPYSYTLSFLPNGYCIRFVDSCKKFMPSPGDIVLLDQNGVDVDFFNPNGALVITMSGDVTLNVDLHKPFRVKELKSTILKK